MDVSETDAAIRAKARQLGMPPPDPTAVACYSGAVSEPDTTLDWLWALKKRRVAEEGSGGRSAGS